VGKMGPGTIILLACTANKGEPRADWPRGLQTLATSADVTVATHRGAMWAGKRETR